MEFLDQFKTYLLQGKENPSRITVKNYLADVRKFIKWFETRFMRPFSPRLVTKEIVEDFKTSLMSNKSQSPIASASSVKRYLSSLRKFFQFLMQQNTIAVNPFETTTQDQPIQKKDIWHLKEFQNFLFLSKASKPTIKNYLVDVRQFIAWFDQVTRVLEPSEAAAYAFTRIDGTMIEEYKTRLLYDAKFEARSVNRKLSSLRKYFSFMQTQGFLKQEVTFSQAPITRNPQINMQVINVEAPFAEVSSIPTQEQPEQVQPSSQYSSFPPLRLLQKLGRGSSFVFDLLFLWPVVKLIVAGKYQLWKVTGRQVFAPIGTVAKKMPITSGNPNKSQSPLDAFIAHNNTGRFGNVTNLPKSLYAPIYLSTKNYSLHKKIVHHLRYSRPKWYKRYHSYAFVHYLHFAIFLVYTTILGLTIYQAYKEAHNIGGPVLAALPGSPPRMLAFEGTLSDATNTPITAEQTLRFSLYDSPTASGSSMLWQELQQVQPDHNGNFKTLLGKTEPLYQRLLNENPTLYLGITIAKQAELTPRQQIATTTYSQDSEKLQGLAPITQPNAGTNNVILALDSAGDLIVGGSASPRFEATGGEFTLAGKVLTLSTTEGTNGNVQIVPDGSGIVDIQKPIQNTTNYNNIPGVEGAVEFDDSVAILATTSGQSAFIVNQNGSGDLISASASGIAKFSVDLTGRGTFASDVAVNGNNLTTISTNFNLLNRNVVNLNFAGNASNISVGSSSGQTAINNRLVANNGIYLPTGKDLMLEGFTKTAIPFVGQNKELTQDGENFVWAQDTKRLGLGTNTPLYRIDVRDSQSAGSIAQIYNTNTGTDADALTIKLGNTSATTVNTNNRFISFETAGIGVVGSIKGNGLDGIQIVQSSPGDWAEYMNKDVAEAIPFGSLLCLQENGTVTGCTQSSGTPIGIASEHPTVIAGKDLGDATISVGLVGIVKTRVTSLNGSIKPGDMITASSQKGRGVKAIAAGAIIGRALEAYDNTDPTATGMILVAVQAGWHDPTVAINQVGNVLAGSQNDSHISSPTIIDGIIDRITIGFVEATGLSTQTLSVATDQITVGGILLKDYIATIAQETTHELENQFFTRKLVSPIGEIAQVNTNIISPLSDDTKIAMRFDQSRISVVNPNVSSTSAVASIDNEGNASFSGTLRARRIIADEIQGLNIQAATIAANYITNVTNIYNIASNSAQPTGNTQELAFNNQPSENTEYADSDQISSGVPAASFTGEFAMFNQGLIALGGSSFTDVGVSGTLRVGNSMRISDTSIDTVGTELAIQPLRQGNLSLMGGLVTIDTDGNAVFSKDVTVNGKFAANLIVPVPDQDLLMQLPTDASGKESKFEIQTGTGSAALTVNQYGDVVASGSGSFGNVAAKAFTIIRGVQADTSLTQTVAQGSGGTAVITANERERTIVTPYIKPNSLIYVTPTSQTYGVTPYIARQTDNSFTIQIPYPVTHDIKLNWWIVN